MIDLHDIRYLRIGTPNLENAIDYCTRIVGLQLVAREGKAAYFRSDKPKVRGDTRDHTLVYFEGDPSDHVAAFDILDRDALDNVAAEIEAAGHPVHWGTTEECELRRVKNFIAFKDPTGNKLELSGHNKGESTILDASTVQPNVGRVVERGAGGLSRYSNFDAVSKS